jgi:predicted nucleotidyltransferase component of viral defense system
MDKIALLNEEERKKIFQDVAAEATLSAAIIEKDFWVCRTLWKIFSDTGLQKILCFKGGTSLSKVFKIIERFSEDIDLILDWNTVLNSNDNIIQPSASRQDAFNKNIEIRAENYISTELKETISKLLGGICSVEADKTDGHILYVTYPKSFSGNYIRPEIKLEIGPLAAWTPQAKYPVSSYVAQTHKELAMTDIIVPTIKAERTFWEKATILHREYFRHKNNTPPRYSRHYYDLFKMGNSEIKDKALESLALLEDVVAFKDRFYHCNWARYDLAKIGSLHLFPNNDNLSVLATDYKNMQNMIFGKIPDWEEILSCLKMLEKEINM